MATAKEIGQRCRKFRNALGLSQQGLADKIGTTPQNISKYEKDGIYNIEMIQELSQALGHDLLSDEMDAEGKVGEIGQEILAYLVDDNMPFNDEKIGYAEADNILDGKVLYGLDQNRIMNEIFKLEKLGLCVREQYIDYYGDRKDRIFITAKGAITLKHISEDIIVKNNLQSVITYEMICKGYDNYQEYIDNQILEKKIRNLKINSGFRANFIHYLHKKYEAGLDKYRYDIGFDTDLIVGENCYFDIMYHMVLGLSIADLEHYLNIIYKYQHDETAIEDELGIDTVEYSSETLMRKYVPGIDTVGQSVDNIMQQYQLDEDEKFMEKSVSNRFEEMVEKNGSRNPFEWFIKDDIQEYIILNYKPALDEKEKMIEQQLFEIMDLGTEIAKEYFLFPKEWENNGLAALVRKLFGVVRL